MKASRSIRVVRRRSHAWVCWLLLASVTLSTSGCLNEMVMLSYLVGGPPSVEPDFDKTTKESLTDYEVTAAVVCFAPQEVQWDFDEIHYQIAKHVTYRLHQHHVKVINPDQVRAWLDKNDEWEKPEDLGAAMDVKYVIFIDLHNFSLYEENSQNLFRGRAEAVISVTKMDEDGNGERIYSKELTSKFPLGAPRSTYDQSEQTFKSEYMARLSEEIGRLFYEHYNGEDMHDAV